MYTRVLTAVIEHGEGDVASRLTRALDNNVPIALALAADPAPPPSVAGDALPEALAAIEIESGVAADYDELVGGDQ